MLFLFETENHLEKKYGKIIQCRLYLKIILARTRDFLKNLKILIISNQFWKKWFTVFFIMQSVSFLFLSFFFFSFSGSFISAYEVHYKIQPLLLSSQIVITSEIAYIIFEFHFWLIER